MTAHRFKVGAVVSMEADGRSGQASRYIVEALMPPLGNALQYRIKSEAEGFRRVVVEYALTAYGEPPAPQPNPPAATRPHPGEAD